VKALSSTIDEKDAALAALRAEVEALKRRMRQ
jgi:hypothetical protein